MLTKHHFVEAAERNDIALGAAVVLVVGETEIALFNVDGTIFAVENACVRCGSSLADGSLVGTEVACSGCDWLYDVTTGSVCGVPALTLDRFEVKIVDTRVMIGKSLSWPCRRGE
jgi:nitrite reductase/ring-hydroxylating ferredoxin subunit